MKTITREEAEKENMTIWEGNDPGTYYARKQFGIDRGSKYYGYVFTLIN